MIGVKRVTPEEKNVLVKSQKISRWNAQKLYYAIGKKIKENGL